MFVDTNVLVYARDAGAGEKHRRARRWMENLWAAGSGRLSVQVLHEYYVTVTRKLDPGMPSRDARADVRDLLAWNPSAVDRSLTAEAWHIEDRYGFSFWDALVVAAAQTMGCSHLLTEDLQAGQDLDGLLVVDPFGTDPDAFFG